MGNRCVYAPGMPIAGLGWSVPEWDRKHSVTVAGRVMAIAAINSRGRLAQRARGESEDESAPRNRALVPVLSNAQVAPSDFLAGRPYVPFLTHLIATSQQAPQTRERRRAGSEEASACYVGAAAVPSLPRTLKRSV